MEKLSTSQRMKIGLMLEDESRGGTFCTWLGERTMSSLLRRGLVRRSDRPATWGVAIEVTSAGRLAYDLAVLHLEQPPSPGRPRMYASKAEKQKAYREKQTRVLDEFQESVCFALAAGDKLAGAIYSGSSGSGIQTVAALTKHFRNVALAYKEMPIMIETAEGYIPVGARSK